MHKMHCSLMHTMSNPHPITSPHHPTTQARISSGTIQRRMFAVNYEWNPLEMKWPAVPKEDGRRLTTIALRLSNMINAFRHRGHFAAMLDPLRGSSHKKLNPHEPIYWVNTDAVDVCRLLKDYPDRLDLTVFGLEEVDPNERFAIGHEFLAHPKKDWSISEVVEFMRATYCGSTAVEYTHLSDRFQRSWIKTIFERGNPRKKQRNEYFFQGSQLGTLSREEKVKALEILLRTDHLERFLGDKFPAVKRFGIEGAEAVLPGLHALVTRGAELGVEGVELGMAHRGRLNVLANLFGKPLGALCNEFTETDVSMGDVKYHLGTYAVRNFRGKLVHMNLAANPSHLEAVNSVVVGKARAKQFFINDKEMKRVMAVLLHGDAAFSGQGIVAEVMELSEIPAYTTGGTVHIVINNMIGFTTDPRASRSSYHCTNVAKGIEAPIFHVNGDDIEAVIHVCRIAAEWRQTFHKDCVVDIVCYRRHGHNELDEPSLTQPLTYSEIRRHPPVLQLYTTELIADRVVDTKFVRDMSVRVLHEFENEFQHRKQYIPRPSEWLATNWQGEAISSLCDSGSRPFNLTGVPLKTLKEIGLSACKIPEDFSAHPQVKELFMRRQKMLETGEADMALAELLAFGALMLPFSPDDSFGRIKREGDSLSLADTSDALKGTAELLTEYVEHPTVDVRLSGQDSERGTFNQRHAVIYDQRTAQPYTPLNNLNLGPQATFQVCNSSLSEAAVLGFEYGYSLESDLALVIWEAQFGDFANVAQHIIDNFIATGESKWGQKSALVLLLPHGYDGQGPEHSSARLERYLQLVDQDPDVVPGAIEGSFEEELERAWKVLDRDGNNKVSMSDITNYLNELSPTDKPKIQSQELSVNGIESSALSKEEYFMFASAWIRRNDERTHNFCVINPSSPAQYFHVLRRQIHRPYAKPLIVMSPKYLLHHRACRSPLDDMGPNTFFRRTIVENGPGDNLKHRLYELNPCDKIRRLVFCSGKFFYDMYHARSARKVRDIAFIRIEQLAPFPFDRIARILLIYPNAECLWAQEEPKNMGAYLYVLPRFTTAQKKLNPDHPLRDLKYIGRPPSASPATGLYRLHVDETKELLDAILGTK